MICASVLGLVFRQIKWDQETGGKYFNLEMLSTPDILIKDLLRRAFIPFLTPASCVPSTIGGGETVTPEYTRNLFTRSCQYLQVRAGDAP